MLPILLGLLIVVVSLSVLYYWIRGLMIMSKDNVVWTIAGIFFTPIIQLVFYFTKKPSLNPQEQKMFVLYFVLQIVLFVLMIGAFASMADQLAQAPY